MCGMETREIFEKIFTCNICDYERSDFLVKKRKADPSKCDFCNP
jgi:transcription elongation factor Elf1